MKTASDAHLSYARYFAANFALFVNPSEPALCCPTCFTTVALSTLNSQARSAFDLSHIFPYAAGGKRLTLECRACNNAMNSAGDNEIVKAYDLHRALRLGAKNCPVFTKIRALGHELRVVVTPRPEGPHLQAIGPDNNDGNRDLVMQAIAASGKLTAGHDLKNDKILFGYLHSAHLLLFSTFGFGYITSSTGRWIQNVLSTGAIGSTDLIVLDVAPGALTAEQSLYRVGAFSSGGPADAIGITLPNYNPDLLAKIVVVPTPTLDGPDLYGALRQRWQLVQTPIRFTPFETRGRRLTTVEHAFDIYTLAASFDRAMSDEHSFVLGVARAAAMNINAAVDSASIMDRLGCSPNFETTSLPKLVDLGMLEILPPPYRSTLVKLTSQAVGIILSNPQSKRIVEFSDKIRLLRKGEMQITRTAV